MSTKTKQSRPNEASVRSGEIVVRVHMPDPPVAHVLLLNPRLHRGWTDTLAYPLVPEGPNYILPDYTIAAGDGAKMVKAGILEVVDADRGVLIDPVDISYSVVRATLRDGKRPAPNRRQRIDSIRDKFIGDDSFAESVLGLVDSGLWSELEAVAALERTYHEAYANGTAAQRPWIAEALRLLASRGVDTSRGLQGVQRAKEGVPQ